MWVPLSAGTKNSCSSLSSWSSGGTEPGILSNGCDGILCNKPNLKWEGEEHINSQSSLTEGPHPNTHPRSPSPPQWRLGINTTSLRVLKCRINVGRTRCKKTRTRNHMSIHRPAKVYRCAMRASIEGRMEFFFCAPLQQGRRNRFLHLGHPLTSLRSKWDQCWGGGVLPLTYRESNHPSAPAQHSPLDFLRLHPKHAIHSRKPTQVHKFSCWGPEGMVVHHFHWLDGHFVVKTMCEREWLTRLLDVVNATWI